MQGSSNRRGSALVFALITSIILMAMVGALSTVAAKESEVLSGTRELEGARLITEAGLNLVVEDYQKDGVAPPQDWYVNPQDFGNGTFQIVADTNLGGVFQRRLIEIEGVNDRSTWGIEAVIGPVVKPLWDSAIQANADITLQRHPRVDSFDSRIAPYNPMNPNDKGDIKGNGDLLLVNNSSVLGDVEVFGDLNVDGSSSVSGSSIGNGDSVPLDSVDPLVAQMVTDLSATNDNGTLNPAIVTMIGSDPSITLPNNRTAFIGAGDYYLHSMTTSMRSNLVFDTRSGPIRIVVHTDDVSIGRNSYFIVWGDHPVHIYMSGMNKFEMSNLSGVLNTSADASLFQVVINSNDPGGPRFQMGQFTTFYGTVWAPEANIELLQYSSVYGAIIGDEVLVSNYSFVHFDEALATGEWILIPDSYRIYFKRRRI